MSATTTARIPPRRLDRSHAVNPDPPADHLAGPWRDARQIVHGPTSPLPWAQPPAQPVAVEPARSEPEPAEGDPRTMKALAVTAITGGSILAAVGFTGSYTAVRDLAIRKDFGWFSNVFPIGVDAGILVLLALDLYLTRKRMPFPPLRYLAWFLTAATVAFNAAAAEGPIGADPLAASMHGILPLLFIAATEAGRHYIARLADITANRHIESPPWIRWVLAPFSTWRIWRRMRLWQLTSYTSVIERQREAVVFAANLRERHGRRWRRKAHSHELLALKLARFGVPIADTLAARKEPVGAPAETVVSVDRERPIERPPVERPALTERAHAAPTERPGERARKPKSGRPASAPTKPRRAPKKAPGGTLADRRRERVRALYDELGKRPEWTDIRDALVEAKLAPKTISRSSCQRIRERVEHDTPALAALGSDNVRPLNQTGS